MSDHPTYLDLDAIHSERPEIGFRLGGKLHPMVPVSVQSFIDNLKGVQELQDLIKSENANPAEIAGKNLEIACATLSRAYPSISYETFFAMPIADLNRITEYTQSFDGTKKAQEEAAKEAAANPLLAGSLLATTG